MPEMYVLQDAEPRITGNAWICNGDQQMMWDFTLLLPQLDSSRDEIEWAALLPLDGVTCWVAVDVNRRRIEIEPAASEPDFDPQAIVPTRPS